MTLPEVHLAGEAVAALVDGELSRCAFHRAMSHLVRCTECRLAVQSQREAKAFLGSAGLPTLPGDLLGRLHDVPMTADLHSDSDDPGGSGHSGELVLAVADGELVWSTVPQEPRGAPASNAPTPGTAAPAGRRRPRGTRRQRRGDPPDSYPAGRVHNQRLRRGLVGTMAGLAFGVIAAVSPTTTGNAGLPQPAGAGGSGQVVPAGVGLPGSDSLHTRMQQVTSRSSRSSSLEIEQVATVAPLVRTAQPR